MTKESAFQLGNQLLRGFVAAALFAGSGAADDYVVTVDEANTRLARVVATLVPDGDVIAMNDEGNQGLERGWATFVEDLRVTDDKGNELAAAPEKNSRWRLTGYPGGPVKISYTVRLKHDQVSLNFGDNGAAYASEIDRTEVAWQQVRATLLLAEQVNVVVDILSDVTHGDQSFSIRNK